MARNLEEQSQKTSKQLHNIMIIRECMREGKAEDMESFMGTLARAAEEKLTLKPPRVKKKDCHPGLERRT